MGFHPSMGTTGLDGQLLGDIDLVVPYCSVQIHLIFLPGIGEMLRTHRAAPGSGFTPGAVHVPLPELF